jgi:hypothetical protein
VPHRAGTTAHRVRIGLTGLGVSFLLDLLGSVVSRSGRDSEANMSAIENEATNTPTEPLAELGVAPGAETGTDENTSSSKK